MTIPVEVNEPRTFTRTEAIELLKQLADSQFGDPDEYDNPDPTTLSNEELEEELCLSGVVHDNDILGVVD